MGCTVGKVSAKEQNQTQCKEVRCIENKYIISNTLQQDKRQTQVISASTSLSQPQKQVPKKATEIKMIETQTDNHFALELQRKLREGLKEESCEICQKKFKEGMSPRMCFECKSFFCLSCASRRIRVINQCPNRCNKFCWNIDLRETSEQKQRRLNQEKKEKEISLELSFRISIPMLNIPESPYIGRNFENRNVHFLNHTNSANNNNSVNNTRNINNNNNNNNNANNNNNTNNNNNNANGGISNFFRITSNHSTLLRNLLQQNINMQQGPPSPQINPHVFFERRIISEELGERLFNFQRVNSIPAGNQEQQQQQQIDQSSDSNYIPEEDTHIQDHIRIMEQSQNIYRLPRHNNQINNQQRQFISVSPIRASPNVSSTL